MAYTPRSPDVTWEDLRPWRRRRLLRRGLGALCALLSLGGICFFWPNTVPPPIPAMVSAPIPVEPSVPRVTARKRTLCDGLQGASWEKGVELGEDLSRYCQGDRGR